MLKDDDRLRLTPQDKNRWQRITGIKPTGIRSVGDLRRYMADCKRLFPGTSEDARFIHWIIDAEFERCVGREDGVQQHAEAARAHAPDTQGALRALDGGRAELERELVELIVFGGKEAEARVAELAERLRPRGKLDVVRLKRED